MEIRFVVLVSLAVGIVIGWVSLMFVLWTCTWVISTFFRPDRVVF